MRRVAHGVLVIGREQFEAGAILPDTMSEILMRELEAKGLVESDEPKRSAPKRKAEEGSDE